MYDKRRYAKNNCEKLEICSAFENLFISPVIG